MKNRPALAVLLFLALPLVLARRVPAAPPGPAQVRPSGGSHGSPPDPFPPRSPFSLPQGMPVPEPLPWSARGSPGAAAAALELLREEGAGKRREGSGGEGVGPPGSCSPVSVSSRSPHGASEE